MGGGDEGSTELGSEARPTLTLEEDEAILGFSLLDAYIDPGGTPHVRVTGLGQAPVRSSLIAAPPHGEEPLGALLSFPHRAPAEWCGCGIRVRVEAANHILGGNVCLINARVAAFGGVCRSGDDTLRAEHVRVLSVAMGPRQPPQDLPAARAASDLLGVPLVEPDSLRRSLDTAHEASKRIRQLPLRMPGFPPPAAQSASELRDQAEMSGLTRAGFRFQFGGAGGRVQPATFMRARPVIPDGAPVAFGDVIRLSSDVAEARFVEGEGWLRTHAEKQLRRWASADEWELRIAPNLHEPAPPDHPHSRTFRCNRCGDSAYLAAVVAGHVLGSPYKRTRCRACGKGRRMPS